MKHKRFKSLFNQATNRVFHTKSNSFFQTSLAPKKCPESPLKSIFLHGLKSQSTGRSKLKKAMLELPSSTMYPMISSKKPVKNYLPKKFEIENSFTPKEILSKHYRKVSEAQKKINELHSKRVNKEISVYFHNRFQLVNSNKFPAVCRVLEGDYNLERYYKKKVKLSKLVSDGKTMVDDFEKKYQEKKASVLESEREKTEHKKKILLKFKRCIIKASIAFKGLGLNLKQFLSSSFDETEIMKITAQSFAKHEIFEIRGSIKEGETDKIVNLIVKNPKILLYKDSFGQTALHWAAKRNRYDILSFLIFKGARIESKDFGGQTPLHLAARLNCLLSVQILLYELANPFALTNLNEKPSAVTTNETIKFILQRAELLHSIANMGKSKYVNERIRNGLKFLFDYELSIEDVEKYIFVMKS